jgi:Tol biopolymer transport system component
VSWQPDDDRSITAWLEESAPMREPAGLLTRVLSTTSRKRRRPDWAIPERWLPMGLTLRLAGRAGTIISAVLLMSLVLVTGALVAASQTQARELPPPTGPAGNGLIAFTTNGDIWVVGPGGEDPRPFVTSPDIDGPGSWAPDGSQLAFWSLAFDGDPSDQAAVRAFVGNSPYIPSPMSVSVIPADGSEPPRVLLSGITWSSRCGMDLSWSPDSRQLAVSHWDTTDPTVSVIDILSLDGDPPRRLTEHGTDPAWSPDGRNIAYHYLSPATEPKSTDVDGVHVIGADGVGDRDLITQKGSGCAFDGIDWSPDGRSVVYYAKSDGSHDVYVASVDGSGEAVISEDLADEYHPRWSPDGSRIAFQRAAGAGCCFVVSDPDGTHQALLEHPGIAGSTYWSPDGRFLLSMGDGLILVDPTGSAEPIVLFEGDVTFSFPSWQRLAP